MLQHAFYNGICTFAMMIYFFFIFFNIICNCILLLHIFPLSNFIF